MVSGTGRRTPHDCTLCTIEHDETRAVRQGFCEGRIVIGCKQISPECDIIAVMEMSLDLFTRCSGHRVGLLRLVGSITQDSQIQHRTAAEHLRSHHQGASGAKAYGDRKDLPKGALHGHLKLPKIP